MTEDVQSQPQDKNAKQSMLPSEMAKADTFSNSPTILLKDVTGGSSTGEAWIVVKDGKTYHKAIAQDLPALTGGDFYEGWLTRDPASLGFFSTGEMIFDESKKMWILEYEVEGDKSNYPGVVITLEPDDGDPGPAAHVLEGKLN